MLDQLLLEEAGSCALDFKIEPNNKSTEKKKGRRIKGGDKDTMTNKTKEGSQSRSKSKRKAVIGGEPNSFISSSISHSHMSANNNNAAAATYTVEHGVGNLTQRMNNLSHTDKLQH